MIELRELLSSEVPSLVELERLKGTAEHIIPRSEEYHLDEMSKHGVYYLSIYSDQEFAGFLILVLEDTNSVELIRIVVGPQGNGIGQIVLQQMEEFCLSKLNCNRVWLDVFESNPRGQHIYRKLGYRYFKTGDYNGKTLLYFEKLLK